LQNIVFATKNVIDIYSKEPRRNFPEIQYGGFNMAAKILKNVKKWYFSYSYLMKLFNFHLFHLKYLNFM